MKKLEIELRMSEIQNGKDDITNIFCYPQGIAYQKGKFACYFAK